MDNTQTTREQIENMVTSLLLRAQDEALSGLASDPGFLGETVRTELVNRGHKVEFTDINGVQNAAVELVHSDDVDDENTVADEEE